MEVLATVVATLAADGLNAALVAALDEPTVDALDEPTVAALDEPTVDAPLLLPPPPEAGDIGSKMPVSPFRDKEGSA